MSRLLVLALLVAATAARAQGQVAVQNGWELGVRYWFSYGSTQWSHNAQGLDPNFGNPTSILTYEDVVADSVEIHARKNFGNGWFVRGNAGIGWIRDGSFDDEDFKRGQIKFSDSTSPIRGNRLTYATLDIGRDLWALGWTTVGLFAGYHGWSERLDAYGAVFTVGGRPSIGESVASISNEATWDSLRLGVTAHSVINPKMRISLDLAWLPYARLYNEDSHWLRGDLGPAPNVFIEGRGRGFQMDFELRYLFADSWEAGAGFRHWWIQSRKGDVSVGGSPAPLVELESRRTGITLSLTRRW
jgi:hypothetical protein